MLHVLTSYAICHYWFSHHNQTRRVCMDGSQINKAQFHSESAFQWYNVVFLYAGLQYEKEGNISKMFFRLRNFKLTKPGKPQTELRNHSQLYIIGLAVEVRTNKDIFITWTRISKFR